MGLQLQTHQDVHTAITKSSKKGRLPQRVLSLANWASEEWGISSGRDWGWGKQGGALTPAGALRKSGQRYDSVPTKITGVCGSGGYEWWYPLECAGGAWQTTVLQCCAGSMGQLYTRAAGLAFPPPRGLLNSGVRDFIVPVLGWSLRWCPVAVWGIWTHCWGGGGRGEEEKEPNGAARSQTAQPPSPLPTCCLSAESQAGLADVPNCFGCQQNQCSSYLWLTGKMTRGHCSHCQHWDFSSPYHPPV